MSSSAAYPGMTGSEDSTDEKWQRLGSLATGHWDLQMCVFRGVFSLMPKGTGIYNRCGDLSDLSYKYMLRRIFSPVPGLS